MQTEAFRQLWVEPGQRLEPVRHPAPGGDSKASGREQPCLIGSGLTSRNNFLRQQICLQVLKLPY
jgi:hypothetical protein